MPTPVQIYLMNRDAPLAERLDAILWWDRGLRKPKHQKERKIVYFKGIITGIALAFIVLIIIGLAFKDPLTKYYQHLTGGKTPNVTQN